MAKFLGLNVDRHLKWNDHINTIVRRVNKYCFLIRTLRLTVPLGVFLNVYYAYVESSLRYEIVIWRGSSHVGRLFAAQKRCVRAIIGAGPRTHCKQVFQKLNILTIYDLCLMESTLFQRKQPGLFNENTSIHDHTQETKMI